MSHASSVPGPLPDRWKDAEQLLFHFDRAWRSGTPPRIEDYLTRLKDAGLSRGVLEDLVKIDLEYRWRQKPTKSDSLPSSPRLEDYAKQYPQLGADISLALIGEEYLVRQRWGDRPRQAEYVSRFPRQGAKLLSELAKIDAELASDLAGNGGALAVSPAGRPVEQAAVTVAALASSLTTGEVLAAGQKKELARLTGQFSEARLLAGELLRRGWLTAYQVNQLLQGRGAELTAGPYVLLERLGEGGAGQVFKARHRRLDRLVALKLIRKELLADPEVVGRFQREIQVLSQLDHPNIVHAYDAGAAGGTHFLAMEYVEGSDLGRLVKQGGPMPVFQACAYIRQAALGLQHAHERGLVHRDIKPHNLIMSVRDGLIKVADLGLARLPRTLGSEATAVLDGLNSTGTLTPQNAVMMGTADYLAPEQALDFHKADIRADIYSLGCTFYYLLAGQPPFAGGNLAHKVAKHLQSEPPPIEQFRRHLPPGVGLVLGKMLAKRAEDRYQTPEEVAQALAPLAQGDLSAAATPRKNRRRVLLLGAAAILIAALALLVLRPFGVGSRTKTDTKPFWPGQVQEFALHKQQYLHAIAFSGNSKVAASAGPNNGISIWDTATGSEQFTLPAQKGAISHLALSPNGRFLASGSSERKTWKLWDLNDRQELGSFTVDAVIHPGEPLAGPFTADGKYLLVRQAVGTVNVVEIAGKKTAVAFPPMDGVTALAITADSRIFAASGGLGHIRVFDVATRKQLATAGDGNHVYALAFSPDGALLATARWSKEVHLLDAATLKPRSICKGHSEGVLAMAFTPDGKTLATAGGKEIKLWDPNTGKERDTFKGHIKAVRALSFTPDGKVLLSGGDDDMVRIWRVRE
jgi:serine/threonine protein kinase